MSSAAINLGVLCFSGLIEALLMAFLGATFLRLISWHLEAGAFGFGCTGTTLLGLGYLNSQRHAKFIALCLQFAPHNRGKDRV
jgi:hypothetical protein